MHILFFASIRDCTKEKEIRWDGPAGTVGELLAALSARYGSAFRKWVLDGEELSGLCMKTRLGAGDTIAIFPAIAGGRTVAGTTSRSAAETQRERPASGFPISSLELDVTGREGRRG
jgi:molybdopterin converting factor small subunit